MSVQAMAWVFDYSEATKGERLVLLALANHLNGETGLCCPGIDLLASEVRLSHSATWRAIQRLEEGGHVEVVRSAGRGNRYRILGYEQARNAPTHQARSAVAPGASDPETRRAHAPLTNNRNEPSRGRLADEISECPLGLCSGTGWVDVEDQNAARICECRSAA